MFNKLLLNWVLRTSKFGFDMSTNSSAKIMVADLVEDYKKYAPV